ncbi:MAG: D-alanyl-D-alanine carboxypeptidase [Candidatus Marsarchaeota archaeon]|nr:D-alanyl-D-alanine carboxypeptidase [Candidatus Marsarchaeota archaeon]
MISSTVLRRGPLVVIIALLTLASISVISAERELPHRSRYASQICSTLVVPPSPSKTLKAPQLKGASAALMDADTGQLLYAKDAHTRRPMASTTKIMTAILILEHCKMNNTITVSKEASLTPYTSLHLEAGEKISVKDLFTGMLIRSANDAAVAAADYIAGSTRKFVRMMNAKAKELGLRDTHFVTPNGLYAEGHYSSAYDLCLMARYAFRYPAFDQAIKTMKYRLTSRTMDKNDMVVYQTSKFLKVYPGADGVKSGYIKQAGNCYVGSATRNGWRLVSAVLKSKNTTADTEALMNYGFGDFDRLTLARAGRPCAKTSVIAGAASFVPVEPVSDLKIDVPKSGCNVTTRIWLRHLEAPVLIGERVGVMVAAIDGKRVAKVQLCAAENINISLARKAAGLLKVCGLVVVCLVGGRYAAAFTKGSRRRRRRIA